MVVVAVAIAAFFFDLFLGVSVAAALVIVSVAHADAAIAAAANGQSIHVRPMRKSVLPVRANGQSIHARLAKAVKKPHTRSFGPQKSFKNTISACGVKKTARKPNCDQECTSKKTPEKPARARKPLIFRSEILDRKKLISRRLKTKKPREHAILQKTHKTAKSRFTKGVCDPAPGPAC